jgi:tripartite-type tricarboxylate transporter receptor subunit TctC
MIRIALCAAALFTSAAAFAQAYPAKPIRMIAVELLKQATKTDLVHVPYKSGGLSAIALLTGEVAVSFNTIPSALPYVKAGRLRAIGVSSLQRSKSVPDVPTISEMGYPGFSASGMSGLVAPAGTPFEAIQRLHAAVVSLLNSREFRNASSCSVWMRSAARLPSSPNTSSQTWRSGPGSSRS